MAMHHAKTWPKMGLLCGLQLRLASTADLGRGGGPVPVQEVCAELRQFLFLQSFLAEQSWGHISRRSWS
eukprot:4175003-Pyramimonas_sp.AAC.1